tara:strand:+ start:368 stop:532 length:165 start_codon:yes stop_codon:yes gene_type:complete
MNIGDLVRHTTLDHYGVVIDKWGVKDANTYIQIHWITGDLNAIWYQMHQYLEVI